MLIGYMRPTHEDPKCMLQKERLLTYKCAKLFVEEHASATKRVQLEKMLDCLKPGNQLIVEKLFVLADSSRHLVELMEAIEEKGATIRFIHEQIDTSQPKDARFIEFAKQLVAFQSDVISEQTRLGMERAKKQGLAPGRPRKPDANVKRAIEMYESKLYSLSEIREKTGISKSTLYRYLEQ